MTWLIRLATAADIDAAIEAWRAANPATRLTTHPDNLRLWAREPDAWVLVADEQGAVSGTVWSLPARQDDGRGELMPYARHLTGLAVRPHRQGQGVGAALLDEALARARQADCSQVTLWTLPVNAAALRLFEARGFRRTGRTAIDEAGELMIHVEWRA